MHSGRIRVQLYKQDGSPCNEKFPTRMYICGVVLYSVNPRARITRAVNLLKNRTIKKNSISNQLGFLE